MSGIAQIIPVVFGVVATIATGGLAAPALMLGGGLFTSVAAGIGLTGTLGAIVAGAASSALTGAIVGGIGSAITGGDFLDGVKQGAIGGAITGGIGGALSSFGGAAAGAAGDVTAGDFPTASIGSGGSFDGTSLPTPNGSGGLVGGATSAPAVATNAIDAATQMDGPVFSGGGSATPAAATPVGPVVNGAASNGVAGTATPTGSGGLLDGILNKETIGGALSGVGKVLSGDTVKAGAEVNNQGAMDRQTQAQGYVSNNYNGSGGLLVDPATTPDATNGRPTPAQAFAQPGNAQWEYYYDPTTHTLQKRPATRPGATATA